MNVTLSAPNCANEALTAASTCGAVLHMCMSVAKLVKVMQTHFWCSAKNPEWTSTSMGILGKSASGRGVRKAVKSVRTERLQRALASLVRYYDV